MKHVFFLVSGLVSASRFIPLEETASEILPTLEFAKLELDFATFQAVDVDILLPQNCYLTLARVDVQPSVTDSLVLHIETGGSDIQLFKKYQDKLTPYQPPKSRFDPAIFLRSFDQKSLNPRTLILLYIPPHAEYRVTEIYRYWGLSSGKLQHLDALLKLNQKKPTTTIVSPAIFPQKPLLSSSLGRSYVAYLSTSFAQEIREVGISKLIEEMYRVFFFAPDVPASPVLSLEESMQLLSPLPKPVVLPQDVYLTFYTIGETPSRDSLLVEFSRKWNCHLAAYLQQDGKVMRNVFIPQPQFDINDLKWKFKYRLERFDQTPGSSLLLHVPFRCELHLTSFSTLLEYSSISHRFLKGLDHNN